ncbi:NfeD family protein [Stieleria varia]|uniref:NfeD-like C-terminal domain-containing protein n=1 Tax=Stieleria varia TaxID=2528005 RepID=A0A5C6AU20_9BACT|nr:NfeD family protein [Stieleria varia]TWU02699.1 hypothetical protein Pla52n_37570 [Stieleria varia]
MPLYYAIGLLFLFVILLIVEFFIPTAGMLGVAAAITAVMAIVIGFTHSTLAGGAITAFVLTATPVILITVIRIWPNTVFGKLILNRRPGQEHVHDERTTRSGRPLKELEGMLGVAKSDLLPAGLIEIAGHKMDAISTGTPIDAGTRVVVVNTNAGKIRVRIAMESEIQADADANQQVNLPDSLLSELPSAVDAASDQPTPTSSTSSPSNASSKSSKSSTSNKSSPDESPRPAQPNMLDSLDLDSLE